jgi:hypothetical protein
MAFVAGTAGHGQPARPDQKLGIALVGLGKYSTNELAPALLETKSCYLAGVVTGSLEKGKKWAQDFRFPERNIFSYETMADLKKLAVNVERENVEARDVTREYVDLDARLRNARAEEAQYLQILKGQSGWDGLIKQYDFNAALIPSQSALASLLRVRPDWQLVEDDNQAALFRRK